MNIQQLYEFCLSKKGVTEDFPFDEDTLVFKVMGKMFALASLSKWEKGEKTINLKCDPQYAEELRTEYKSIIPGYHMNKTHWNTIDISSGELDFDFIRQLITHSYELVVKNLPKAKRP
jgi:predicted DNA-binding protein (MmcQ/YjbR family)